MAGVGGDGAPAAFAVGPIQAQVAACANVDAFDALYAGNAHAPARRAMEGFGMVHPDAGVRLSATQKRQTHQEQEIRNLQAGLAAGILLQTMLLRLLMLHRLLHRLRATLTGFVRRILPSTGIRRKTLMFVSG